MNHPDPDDLAPTEAEEVADLQQQIADLLADLEAALPSLELLTDTRYSRRGFASYAGLQAQGQLLADDRRLRRAQPIRRDPHTSRRINGLDWLNRSSIIAGTGEISAPGNFVAIGVEATVHFTIADRIRHVRKYRKALAFIAGDRAIGHLVPDPDPIDLVRHLGQLVTHTPIRGALAQIPAEIEDLLDQCTNAIEGPSRELLEDLCPHCERRTLVRYIHDGITRCEVDPRDPSGHYKPCTCQRLLCPCKTSPITFRHQWHDNPADKTEISVWDLHSGIKHKKELAAMETRAIDSVNTIRALHQPVPVRPWAEDCDNPDHTHDPADNGSGDLCFDCPPIGQACGHCTHDTDDDYTPHPCRTVQATAPVDQT